MIQGNETCMDCGAPLHGPFCSQCGQKASDYHRSLILFVKDFLRDILTLEAKLFQSLKLLVAKPGSLTVAYIQGQRTRFISPLKLYLTISVLFFFLRTVVFLPDMQRVIGNVEGATAKVTEAMVPLGQSQAEEEEIRQSAGKNKVITKMLSLQEQGRLAPFMATFFNRIPTLMFLIMPLFALVLRLLYLRHGARFFYFEHLIFSLHGHAFFFLVGVLTVVIPTSGVKTIFAAAIMLVYHFLAMRRVYGQGRFKTLLKWVIHIVIYGLLCVLAVGLLMIISLARA